MGMQHSAYFAYGVRIPDDVDVAALATALEGGPVGYLRAGDYDRDMTFLVTLCERVELGEYESVLRASFDRAEWACWPTAIRLAAEKIGVTPMGGPSWFFVPDLS